MRPTINEESDCLRKKICAAEMGARGTQLQSPSPPNKFMRKNLWYDLLWKTIFWTGKNHFHTVIALYLELSPKPGDHRNWQLCKYHYKKPGTLERGCRGGHCLSQGGGAKVPFFIFGKYLRYLKKSLHVRFIRRKLQIMNPLIRVRSQKICPPPPRNSDRSNVPAKNLILFSIFRGSLSTKNCED
jgi:hypothetical protein